MGLLLLDPLLALGLQLALEALELLCVHLLLELLEGADLGEGLFFLAPFLSVGTLLEAPLETRLLPWSRLAF